MIRALLLCLLLTSNAEAMPITFGASATTTQHQTPEGPAGMDISAIGVGPRVIVVPDGLLQLTLPLEFGGPCFSGPFSCFARTGNFMLTLQSQLDGSMLGGYRFVRFRGENSDAQYVRCTSPNNCVSEIGRGGEPVITFFFPPLFNWPEVSFDLPDRTHLLIPSVPGGKLLATIDLSVSPDVCITGAPSCVASVEAEFTLETVPEPATLLLLSTTTAGLGYLARRRRKDNP